MIFTRRLTSILLGVIQAGLVHQLIRSRVLSLSALQVHPTNGGEHDLGQDSHASLMVDTKIWFKDTEFDERVNWRNQLRPCSLNGKTVISEDAVVAFGGSLWNSDLAIATTINEFVLPQNGHILLEQDSVLHTDDVFHDVISQLLEEIGHCVDPSINHGNYFQFEPHSDDMSWFNPSNWESKLIASRGEELVAQSPESHLIPCTEDFVVLGSQNYGLLFDGPVHHYDSALSFKINFRASESSNLTPAILSGVAVSNLKIDDIEYSQEEFNQMINSDMYKNILFEVNHPKSLIRGANTTNDIVSPIIIDESSIQARPVDGFSDGLCLDEAGCFCGNENDQVMKAICSFVTPVDSSLLPCSDPISSVGYCDKICATSLTILIDPGKFSERMMNSLLKKLIIDQDNYARFATDKIFVAARRTDFSVFEVTFRLMPEKEDILDDLIGNEREIAYILKEHLEQPALKSFYGIKNISIRSSENWYRDTSASVFMIALVAFISLSLYLTLEEDSKVMKQLMMVGEKLNRLRWAGAGTTFGHYDDSRGQFRINQVLVQDDNCSQMGLIDVNTIT